MSDLEAQSDDEAVDDSSSSDGTEEKDEVEDAKFAVVQSNVRQRMDNRRINNLDWILMAEAEINIQRIIKVQHK